MKCQDVRRSLALLDEGQLALTEWAIVQNHLYDCVECRKELERVRDRMGEQVRARRRRLALAILGGATAGLLVGAGGVSVYQGHLLLPTPDLFRIPSWGGAAPPAQTAMPDPAPEPPAPVAPPTPAAPPPPPARPFVEPTPRLAAPSGGPTAGAEAPAEERMPTQRPPSTAVRAAPDAEVMPSQGDSRRP